MCCKEVADVPYVQGRGNAEGNKATRVCAEAIRTTICAWRAQIMKPLHDVVSNNGIDIAKAEYARRRTRIGHEPLCHDRKLFRQLSQKRIDGGYGNEATFVGNTW